MAHGGQEFGLGAIGGLGGGGRLALGARRALHFRHVDIGRHADAPGTVAGGQGADVHADIDHRAVGAPDRRLERRKGAIRGHLIGGVEQRLHIALAEIATMDAACEVLDPEQPMRRLVGVLQGDVIGDGPDARRILAQPRAEEVEVYDAGLDRLIKPRSVKTELGQGALLEQHAPPALVPGHGAVEHDQLARLAPALVVRGLQKRKRVADADVAAARHGDEAAQQVRRPAA